MSKYKVYGKKYSYIGEYRKNGSIVHLIHTYSTKDKKKKIKAIVNCIELCVKGENPCNY